MGSVWNYAFVGSENAPASKCTDDKLGQGIITIPSTPSIAEKPFIVFENNKYYLAVPAYEVNKVGPSNYDTINMKIDFEDVFVARETDSADTIN